MVTTIDINSMFSMEAGSLPGLNNRKPGVKRRGDRVAVMSMVVEGDEEGKEEAYK